MLDSWHDTYRGVVCLVRVVDGTVSEGEQIASLPPAGIYEVLELGIVRPEGRHRTKKLVAGQVGYVMAGMRSANEVQVGSTLFSPPTANVEALPSFKEPKAMVFSGVYPAVSGGFDALSVAMQRLCLTDPAVSVQRESSDALGAGFRCGFLGLLHMDVFRQRLSQEHGVEAVLSAPTVEYRVLYRDGRSESVTRASQFPSHGDAGVLDVLEPWVDVTVVAPDSNFGTVMQLMVGGRGEEVSRRVTGAGQSISVWRMPLAEVVSGLHDALKAGTRGFGSMEYVSSGWESGPIEKMDILLNGECVDALSTLVHR